MLLPITTFRDVAAPQPMGLMMKYSMTNGIKPLVFIKAKLERLTPRKN